ncbi:MAG: transglutaminase domain-containing protein [Planctomycetes bacterium]|nr:transglutaminase domain-containing protein [Planctomycetota bacterium]HPF12733.1 transglutaminaseTgpA domain-containing protein [Planctomycetota bacterium]
MLPAPASVTHRALLLCMVGMVLCNVLFVQLTQAAEPSWLMPLYALALAAPFLDRYKDKLWYRALWNTGVLALFTLLVQHATSRNLEFVLQDGLFLAVLCQVHLLNNLRTDQRPDLLFLNSFLIAVITGYITVDLGFAAAFLVYAPFFLMGMQFLSMVRPGETLEPRVVRAVVWDGVRRSGVLLGLALLVFFFWPRDFDRPALFAEYLDFPTPDGGSEIGFSESLELKRHEGLSNDRRVVLTVQPTSGDVADVPELWRGATLPVHEGRDSWTGLGRVMAQGEAGADPAWYPIPRGLSRQPDEAVTDPETAGIGLRVARLDSSTQRLFLPRDAQTVWLDKRHTQGRLHADGDGTLLYPNPGALYYTVQRKAAATDATPHGRGNSNATEDLGNFVRLNPTTVSRSAVLLARRLRKQLAETAPSSEVVTAFATYLSTQFTYRFPGDPKAAGSLDEFLTTDAGGHCEFFASALATMLRSSQIPCRIVTGYRSSDWNAANRTRTLYNSDAHAWVEVLDPILGWYAVDPTPAGAPQAMGLGWWSSAKGQVAGWWNRITGFDEQSRSAVMAWLQATPGNVLASMERHPLRSTGLGLVCGMALWMLRQRKRRIEPESIRALRKALATAGFEPNGSRTPRELLAGLDTASLSEVQQAGLRQAVEQHERDRYAA